MAPRYILSNSPIRLGQQVLTQRPTAPNILAPVSIAKIVGSLKTLVCSKPTNPFAFHFYTEHHHTSKPTRNHSVKDRQRLLREREHLRS